MDKEYIIEKLLSSGFDFTDIGMWKLDKDSCSQVDKDEFFDIFALRWNQLEHINNEGERGSRSIQQIYIGLKVFNQRELNSFMEFMNNVTNKTEILFDKEKDIVVCECGCSDWKYKCSRALLCNPPINISMYECIECGNIYEEKRKSIMDLYAVGKIQRSK